MVVMNIVEFLEARIAEEEANIRDGSFVGGPGACQEHGSEDKDALAERIREESAEKRVIIASWREAADDEGIEDPREAEGTVAVARRAMLTILAGSYRRHPDYDPEWSPDLPTAVPAEVRADSAEGVSQCPGQAGVR